MFSFLFIFFTTVINAQVEISLLIFAAILLFSINYNKNNEASCEQSCKKQTRITVFAFFVFHIYIYSIKAFSANKALFRSKSIELNGSSSRWLPTCLTIFRTRQSFKRLKKYLTGIKKNARVRLYLCILLLYTLYIYFTELSV